MAESDFRRARKSYGRAVGKEPTNQAFLDKLEVALLKIRPNT